ncbi:MAG: ARMT1-like domain-containing protein [Propionibacteriaceae bacterium]|jgi:uncharacterized protein with ATP-grasp and redox domains|nr:ARMT1-like domain-containing protein [Propionibacteriaceae bacterium]
MRLQVTCVGCQVSTVARALSRVEAPAQRKLELIEDYSLKFQTGGDVCLTINDFYRRAKVAVGSFDPLAQDKAEQNAVALQALPLARTILDEQPDRLATAIRLAVIGNMIDFAFGDHFDVETAVRGLLDLEFAIDDYDAFRDRLVQANSLTLSCDNAGEVIFDGVLVEEIARFRTERGLPPLDIAVIVKSGPVINDAMRADAELAGLDRFATIVESGTDGIGLPPTEIAPTVHDLLVRSDLILAKGMANFESTFDYPTFARHTFYLFKAKCLPVANVAQVPVASMVLADGATRSAAWTDPA